MAGLAAKSVVALIGAYRRFLSPLLPRACRFLPSCSDYGVQAIERHGLARGLLLAASRLMRCNPLCRGGWDPIR